MTFLRLGISSFFIIAPAVAYFSGMDPKVALGLLIPGLWGLFSAAGEGALGLHHVDAYGPLSPYNDDSDSGLTMLGKISAGVVALMGMVLFYFAASAYMDKKDKPPVPVPTSSPAPPPTKNPTPAATKAPVASKTPAPVATAAPTPTGTPTVAKTPAPAASAAPEDPDFEKQKFNAESKVLSRDYKGASAILDDLEKQSPNDVEVLFYRFLALQGLNEDDKAKEYAERILKEHSGSKYERRLDKFLKSFELAEKRKKLGGHSSSFYAIEKEASIELTDDTLLAEANDSSLDQITGSQIGLELISDEPQVKPSNLKAGTSVTPIKSVHYYLKLNSGEFSWEKSRKTRGAAEVDLVYVKVNNGARKGKQGWLINNLRGAPKVEDKPSRNARNILKLAKIK